MYTILIIGIKVPGFHRWSGAPEEVNFLKYPHRHMFSIRVTLLPNHDDRDYEFFMEQSNLRAILDSLYIRNDKGYEFQGRSCEMIAKDLLNTCLVYDSVEVGEDDENYALVFRRDLDGVCKCHERQEATHIGLGGYRERGQAYPSDVAVPAPGGYRPDQGWGNTSVPPPPPFLKGQAKDNSGQVRMEEPDAYHPSLKHRAPRLDDVCREEDTCCGRHTGHGAIIGFGPIEDKERY